VAESLDAHALEDHGGERRRLHEPSRRRRMGARALEERWPHGHCSTKKGESNGSERKKTRGMGTTPPRLTLFIEGSTQSIRCGSLLRTTRPNGSIPRS
jgi:hypothetical protein